MNVLWCFHPVLIEYENEINHAPSIPGMLLPFKFQRELPRLILCAKFTAVFGQL